MMTTDPIADMLTRIRNALTAGKSEVIIPHSKIKFAIAQILEANSYIQSVKVTEVGVFKQIEVGLNGKNVTRPITKLMRVSKPGRRIYAKVTEIPQVLNGRGLVIVSTPSGLMTGVQARQNGLGGELICKVY